MNNYDINKNLKEYKDDELRKIIYTQYGEYREEIIQAARNELYSRYDINFWEKDDLKLGQLSLYCDFCEVSEKLLEFYPMEKGLTSKYEEVFNKLRQNYEINPQKILLSLSRIKCPLNGIQWDIHGIDIETEEKVDLQYCKWSEWASFLIDKKQLQNLGKDAYIAHCLKKMTTLGFDEEEIQNEFTEIQEVNEVRYDPLKIDSENKNINMDNFISEGLIRRNEFKGNAADEELKNHNVRPWIRYFARSIDIYIWLSIVSFTWNCISKDTYGILNSNIWSNLLISVIQCLLWIFIEALLLSKLGFTLGKWLLNVYVRDSNNKELTYNKALKRAVNVFLYGQGIYIPLVSFIANIVSYSRLTGTGKTKWDEYLQISVSHKSIDKYKAFIAIVILIVVPIIRFIITYIQR